jgi:uncharacterized protein YacL
MNCVVSGILGLGLLGGSLLTMTVSEEEHMRLKATLSDQLDQIYTNIAIERRNLYLQGLVLGLFFATALAWKVKLTNKFHKVTFMVAITLMVAVTYYSLMPKSDYMLNHLKTSEQNKAWLDVYKTMKQKYMLGVIGGAVAAIPLSYAMC